MAKTESVIAIEFDSPNNASFRFTPLQQVIRGRFDLHRVKEPQAGKLLSQWAEPIPSQVLQFNLETGDGAIIEPLWEERFAALREKIEAKGQRLPPARQVFKLDSATFAYWIRGLVGTGDAKIVSGELPANVPGTPRTRFHSSEQVDPIDRLAAAIERQSAGQERILELLTQAIAKLAK